MFPPFLSGPETEDNKNWLSVVISYDSGVGGCDRAYDEREEKNFPPLLQTFDFASVFHM